MNPPVKQTAGPEESALPVDGVLLSIIQTALESVAEEMGRGLQRTAYSTNIKDRLDFSCAVFDPHGCLVAQAEHIPLHLGQLAGTVKNLLAEIPIEAFTQGDAVMCNDPWITGAHLPDIVVVAPVYHEDGELVGFVASLAHHVDVGGFAPGSMYSQATEIFQEGIRLTPVWVRRRGDIDRRMINLIAANTRTPVENMGDTYAQIAAAYVGEQKLQGLAKKYGPRRLVKYMAETIAYSERRMREGLKMLPRGSYDFEDYLEGDGVDLGRIRIHARVTIDNDGLSVDFSQSQKQARGPINATLPFALSCVALVFKSVVDPSIPSNEGIVRSFSVVAPEGSVLNATFPAAVSNNSSVLGLRIVDVLMGALGQVIPKRVTSASSGTMNVVTIGGVDPRTGAPYAYIESYGGGQGGMFGQDGMDGVQSTTSNTRNAPVEVIETYYPFQVQRYELVRGSAGAGQWRGGMGLRRALVIQSEASIGVVSDRQEIAPWGLEGGKPGGTARCYLVTPEGDEQRLIQKCTVTVRAGTRVILETAGGGGWGLPSNRDPGCIQSDLLNGYIDSETAQRDYGRRAYQFGDASMKNRSAGAPRRPA